MNATRRVVFFMLVAVSAALCLSLSGCGGTAGDRATAEPPAAAGQPAAPAPASPATGAAGKASESRPSGTLAPAASAAAPAAPVPPPPPPPPPRRATLEAGTPIPIITASLLSTKTNKTGERFRGTLAEDLVVGDWVVARQGARVSGHIADANPGGRVKGTASIALTLDEITLADGQQIAVATDTGGVTAKSSAKKDAAKIAGGAGVGGVIGAIAGGGKGAAIGAAIGGGAGTAATLATRGEAATLPSRTRVTFTLKAPVEVTEKR
jgi:hypothetical protein